MYRQLARPPNRCSRKELRVAKVARGIERQTRKQSVWMRAAEKGIKERPEKQMSSQDGQVCDHGVQANAGLAGLDQRVMVGSAGARGS